MTENNKVADFLGKVAQWSFTMLFFFPLAPLTYINIVFFVFFLSSCCLCFYSRNTGFWINIRKNLIIVIPFIPYIIEFALYNQNTVVEHELQKKLLFFLGPLAVAVFSTNRAFQSTRYHLSVFTGSLVVITIYGIIMLWHNQILFSSAGYENGARLLRSYFENFIHLHPTYYCTFADIAILWLLYDFKNRNINWRVIYIISGLILFFPETLLASRMPYLALILGAAIVLYKVTTSLKIRVIAYIGLSAVLALAFVAVPSLKNRLIDAEPIFISNSHCPDNINERVIILDCDKQIFSNNFWTGVGARNAQNDLNACYSEKQFAKSDVIPIGLNAHNQFFSLGINYGIGIVLLFTASLIWFIVKVRKDFFSLIFILVTFMVMLTESLLERPWGIYYYAFFFLLFYNKRSEKA